MICFLLRFENIHSKIITMDNNELFTLQELASSGNKEAIEKLADYYVEIKDYERAFLTAQRFDYFTCASGYKKLAQFYQKGIGVAADQEKAISYYQKSFDMGDMSSGYYLATFLIKEKQFDKALNYLAIGMSNDYIPSIRLLANMYLNGDGVDKNIDVAINLYLTAIDLGDVKSMDSLAKIYYSQKDYSNSFKYFQMGALRDDLDCIFHLGVSYAKGLGVKQDFSQAFKYYEIGAKKLEPRSLYNLSLYYRNGIIVDQNIELANKLEEQAYQNGFKK